MASRRLSEERDLASVFARLVANEPRPVGPGRHHGAHGADDPEPLPAAVTIASAADAGRRRLTGRRLRRRLVRLLRAQLDAQQVWLGIAAHFDRDGLGGLAALFRDGAGEHGRRAAEIMRYLASRDVAFELPPIGAAPTRYRSAALAVGVALERAMRTARRADAAAGSAVSRRDLRTLQFLERFAEPEAEQERRLRKLLGMLASGLNAYQAEALLREPA